ncbi:hypothetical protein C5Y96_08580 [Blastopirellula marina]|uniref:DUF4239 domain-containing protein n=1 Tax=Blastopirellula marina TaxID=124 RepID=A0A2S8FUG5_9BACT|nr:MULTISPECIES: hypothetical protein [Pirellulaceae]PQO35700.1 hypothetical protein C5Y96_08580 [Blastopirellula marina]RCS53274.1 hypothetical protein DTL36_08590 [Bremerella cremea]
MASIYDLPTWEIVGSIFVLTFIANEVGFRAGSREGKNDSEGARAVSNGLKASILGLAALLLGFSFSTTTTKHYQRQRLVLDEANAIGTCYLRAGLLGEPQKSELQQSLKRFTNLRLKHFELALDHDAYDETLSQMQTELDQIWHSVETTAQTQPDRVVPSQIVPAANSVIDLNTTRLWSARNHMPQPVVILLCICIIVSSMITGHSSGQVGKRYLGLWFAFNVLLTLVLFVILDFDRPRRGLIQVDHHPLVEVLETMEPASR